VQKLIGLMKVSIRCQGGRYASIPQHRPTFLTFSVYALTDKEIKGEHYHLDDIPDIIEVEEEFPVGDTRRLSTQSYPQFRVILDFSNLVAGTTAFKNYVRNNLVPIVAEYFEAALKVKQPITSKWRLSSSTKSICGFKTPSALSTGVITDFYLIVSSTTSDSNWVASAGSCALASGTKRPLIGQLKFNSKFTKPAVNDPLEHEKNMYLTMHEVIHALGFAGSSFKNFVDKNGKTLSGHIKSVTLQGTKRTVLDVEPLTTKLRNHFGCSTLPGAFMEDDGGSGTAGSHFERRHFTYEAMTSGVMQGLRLSEFSLALLEGSGWYVPDYKYADPFFFGQGEGCGFLYDSCASSSFDYSDFCKVNGRSCTSSGAGGGICARDSRSDDCFYYIPMLDYSCDNPDAEDNARFPEFEVYGRGAGSRCFTGTLSKRTATSSSTSFCLKYKCSGSGLSTKLQVMLGSATVTCVKGGKIKVSGYNGEIECPDPVQFCQTIGKEHCPRNCMGKGSCVNNKCVCRSGYKGIDCAMKA